MRWPRSSLTYERWPQRQPPYGRREANPNKQQWLHEWKICEPQQHYQIVCHNITHKTRSNYFRVKDEAAFREWAESREIEVWNTDEDRGSYFSISSRESNGEGWRRLTFDEESNDPLDLNIAEELAEHLQDGSVAVLIEIGAEKLPVSGRRDYRCQQ